MADVKWIVTSDEQTGHEWAREHLELVGTEYRVVTSVRDLYGLGINVECVIFIDKDTLTRSSNVPDIHYDRTYLGQGYSGEAITASTCSECGALTTREIFHTAWHTKLARGKDV